MATTVYALCGVTSIACAWLLLRGWASTRARLLLWSGLCFVGLALNNVILFLDKVVITDVDLSIPRSVSGLAGLAILLYGMIWELD